MSAPRDPEAAFLLGTMYREAGGAFTILPNGKRITTCDLDCEGGDMLRVRIMLEGLLQRLHPADKDFIFEAFGEVAIDPDSITAAFDEPMRRAA